MNFFEKCPGRYLKVMKEWRSLPILATLSVHGIIIWGGWQALQCFKNSLLEDNLLLGLSRLKMSRIVPIFHDFLGLSQCSNTTPDFRSMSGYRTFLPCYVRKASGFLLKILKMSDNWFGALIYVCAVNAKALRWFHSGNWSKSDHSDALLTAHYVMLI